MPFTTTTVRPVRRARRRSLAALIATLSMLVVACGGGDSSGTPDEAAPEDAFEADPAFVEACADRQVFGALRDFAADPPEGPVAIEARLDEITAEIEAGASAPTVPISEDPPGAALRQIANFLPTYRLAWETVDYDPVELEASGLGAATVGSSLTFAEDWAALVDQACADDFPAGCAERGLSAEQCGCVGETRQAAITYGPELAGPVALDDLAGDCPEWLGDDWCASTTAIADLEDFVLGDFGEVDELSDEIRSGEFTSQEQPIAEARAGWDEFIAGSPPPVAAIAEDIDRNLDDWEAVWMDADYAYARILFEDDLSDAYLAVRDDNAVFVNPMAALTALREVLCDQNRVGFLDGCIADGGTVGTCRCVYRFVGDGAFSDGVPQQPDGNIDVDALVPDCSA